MIKATHQYSTYIDDDDHHGFYMSTDFNRFQYMSAVESNFIIMTIYMILRAHISLY